MKRAILAIFLMTTTCVAQQRNATSTVSLPAPPAGPSGTVTLSLAEYNRLSEMAARKGKKTDAPPQPYVLSRAVFNLRVENQAVIGNIDIEGAVLEKGPTKVPLTTGLTVLEAKQAGQPLPLMQEGATHSAIITGPGTFSVSLNALNVASPLTVEAGRASIVLPVPTASSSVLKLALPGNHANVRVEPGLITNRSTANGQTSIEATLNPGKPVRLWWTTREVAAPVAQRDVRFLSSVKSVVSVNDSQLRVTALCDVTIVQGEAAEFKVSLPTGFELTEVAGSTLDSHEVSAGTLVLRVLEPAKRNHQFLIAMERTNREKKAEAPVISISGAQHETGELLVEGAGAMELIPTESGGLRRMDVREVGAVVRSLSRFPLQAAFRYNRRAGDTPALKLEWTQFPDTQVLAAVAERATITTLTTIEGKSLTEVTLRVRNHAQPFVKVDLPPDSTILSAEVGGERVKPVIDTDGNRVPLMRTGFRPAGAYTVSFVYLSSGAAFSKAGDYDMGLPKLDIPVNLLTWEISLPDRLIVKQFGGNALAAELFPVGAQNTLIDGMSENEQIDTNVWAQNDLTELGPGQVGGVVVDANGAVVTGAVVTLRNTETGATMTTRTDGDGRWIISGMQPGPNQVDITSPGFKVNRQNFDLQAARPIRLGSTLEVGAVSETVTVTSGARARSNNVSVDGIDNMVVTGRQVQQLQMNAPSQNVLNLQRRVAGVLPVKVDVPKAGKSYRFVRPLVLEEETRVTFEYRTGK
jgi:hypothetical protein